MHLKSLRTIEIKFIVKAASSHRQNNLLCLKCLTEKVESDIRRGLKKSEKKLSGWRGLELASWLTRSLDSEEARLPYRKSECNN